MEPQKEKVSQVHIDVHEYMNETKNVSRATRLLWWCAGADAQLLLKSPYYDRVKYAGIGGVVLTTGVLAAFSGGYAFQTIFGAKEFAASAAEIEPSGFPFGAIVFGLIWGLIILNLDRFIVSSTGDGDGSDKITGSEILRALPRIIIALILGVCIAAPLEVRVMESEINAELQGYMKDYEEDLNAKTDVLITNQRASLEADMIPLRAELSEVEEYLESRRLELEELNRKLEEEVDGSGGSGKGGRGASYRTKKANIEKLESELEKKRAEMSLRTSSLMAAIAQKQQDIDQLEEKRKRQYLENEQRARNQDGLVRRIRLAHDISLTISVMLTLLILAIELGPIFFKMMLVKGTYDYLKENMKERVKAQHGIVKQVYFAPNDRSGFIVQDHRYLEVDRDIHSTRQKIEVQKELDKKVIDHYKNEQSGKIDEDPSAFYES